MPAVDVLVPTRDRPAALAAMLATLLGQCFRDFRVVISDQSDGRPSWAGAEAQAVVRTLRCRGHAVDLRRRLPRRGLAEHRASLLATATAPYVLFVDDDVLLAPDLLLRLVDALRRERCGFIGCGLVGPTFERDVRPHEEAVEWWEGPVEPELVEPGRDEWWRHRLHSAANLLHVERRLGATGDRLYKIAWVGGCVLYDAEKLRAAGGFDFWPELPVEHAGEDVLAQLRVMARFGGAGLFPSGAYHQELVTTLESREVDAPRVLT